MADGMTTKEFVNKCGELRERVEEAKGHRSPPEGRSNGGDAILAAMHHAQRASVELMDVSDIANLYGFPETVRSHLSDMYDELCRVQHELSDLWCQVSGTGPGATDPADPPGENGVRVRPGMRVQAFDHETTLRNGRAIAAFADGPEESHAR